MIVTVLVGCAAGLHARAAARVAAVAASCPTPVRVRRDGGVLVPADSVLSLLTLGATYGTELILESSSAASLALVADAIAAPSGGFPAGGSPSGGFPSGGLTFGGFPSGGLIFGGSPSGGLTFGGLTFGGFAFGVLGG